MNIIDDIDGLLSSDISIKEIANGCHLTEESTKAIQDIRNTNDIDKRKEKISALTVGVANKIENFCIHDTYTSSVRERLIKYCNKLIAEKDSEEFSIRLSKGQKNRTWNYCSIAKNYEKAGARDRKEFKIPVNAAMYILNEQYIPHFYNPAD
ncbi:MULTISPECIES: hypothetical protein [Lactobacillus]|uniref:hypothetical protein n=1 Tax=Lactobacillus TaxID=1578 RepID=UPI000BEEB5B7|nr:MULTISPECIES: hypothetical protein [Lactobacillus]MDM8282229.1 hypothetical protein [Lactobacillus gallinarum]PEG86561.1 hypothetical protein CP365_07320 [Lactobacillus sp. UMNPBX14]PEH02109.1 hypothetical protein CP357_07330 [Lactobacillus sp. UMNPBX6]